jgi:tetratricopeptide (TPR) repeat protein
MFKRYLVPLLLMGLLLIVNGCDPKELVKQKVPEPLKDAMSSGGGEKKKGKAGKEDPFSRASITVVSPKRNSVHPVVKEVLFEAKVQMPDRKAASKTTVVWNLYRGAIKKGVQLGRGEAIRKKLGPGQYRVSATLLYKNKKKVKTSSFRVANTIEGRIATSDGAVVSGTKLVLSNIEGGEPLHEAVSGEDGKFLIEVPIKGFFRLRPKQEGYGFVPYDRIVTFTEPPVQQNFKASKGKITDIKFSAEPNSEERIESVCPLQQGYVSFAVTSETKLAVAEAFLVTVVEDKERRIKLEDSSDIPSSERKIHPEGTVLKVQVPTEIIKNRENEATYKLRLILHDGKNHTITGEAPEPIDYNIMGCFRKTLARGIAQQQKGKLEEAIKSYRLVRRLSQKANEPTQFSTFVEQSTFNSGLAYLALAMTKPEKSLDRENMFARALGAFGKTLAGNKSHLDAMLFKGWSYQLAGEYSRALPYYDKILQQEPRYQGVRELRAQAELKNAEKKLKAMKTYFQRLGTDDPSDVSSLGRIIALWVTENSARLSKTKAHNLILKNMNTLLRLPPIESQKLNDLVDRFLQGIKILGGMAEQSLLAVVDDFTETIATNPERKDLRSSRREALEAVFELQDSDVNVTKFRNSLRKKLNKQEAPNHLDHPVLQIDVPKIPLQKAEKVVDIGKYVRQ